MGLLTRYEGVHRAVLSGKAKIAAVATVGLLAAGGGAVAVGAASAQPTASPSRDADVYGYVTLCGPAADARAVNYHGNTGDGGTVTVARNGWYTIHLRDVLPRGEQITGTVDCAYRTHPMVARRPFQGFTVWHSERHDITR